MKKFKLNDEVVFYNAQKEYKESGVIEWIFCNCMVLEYIKNAIFMEICIF